MNEDQRSKLLSLIRAYGRAQEELGGVPSSLYWNAASGKAEMAYDAINDFINKEIGVTTK